MSLGAGTRGRVIREADNKRDLFRLKIRQDETRQTDLSYANRGVIRGSGREVD